MKYKILGMEIEMDEFQDCNWCGLKNACKFGSTGYIQPCNKCRATKKYEDEQKTISKGGITEIFKKRQASGVWEGKGTRFYTNHKGDVIKTEPIKAPIILGKKAKEVKIYH